MKEGARLYRALGEKAGVALAVNQISSSYPVDGDLGHAAIYVSEALEIAQEVDGPWCPSWSHCYAWRGDIHGSAWSGLHSRWCAS